MAAATHGVIPDFVRDPVPGEFADVPEWAASPRILDPGVRRGDDGEVGAALVMLAPVGDGSTAVVH